MKQNLILIFLLTLFFTGCTKEETQQMDFKNDLTISITPYNEFYEKLEDKSGFKISLSETLSAITDTSGSYTFKGLSMGTYKLTISKDGYGSIINQDFIYYGISPASCSYYMMQLSSVQIKTLNLSMNEDTLIVSGTISHKYPVSNSFTYPTYWPYLVAYFNSSSDVSNLNYINYQRFYSNEDNDTLFYQKIYTNYHTYNPGDTIYTVIYGQNHQYYYNTDLELNKFYDPCLGTPSEVKSYVVPQY
jgi:hypothetical protein